MTVKWLDVELVDGPLNGHTTSMLTDEDGVTPRAYTIMVPPPGVDGPAPFLEYRLQGFRLACVPGRVVNMVYLYNFRVCQGARGGK